MLIYTKSLGVWVSWRSGKKNSLACCGSVCVCVCEKGGQKVEWEGCVEQCNCSRVMNKSTEINRKRNLWYFCLIFNLWYATLTLNGCLAYFLVDYTHKHVHTNNEIQLHAHTCTHIASGFWNNALFFWTALDSFGICAAHSSLSLSVVITLLFLLPTDSDTFHRPFSCSLPLLDIFLFSCRYPSFPRLPSSVSTDC